jgi:hypothetical protein
MRGLTSLFGKGRGEHPRQNHHKKAAGRKIISGGVRNNLCEESKTSGSNKVILGVVIRNKKKLKHTGN